MSKLLTKCILFSKQCSLFAMSLQRTGISKSHLFHTTGCFNSTSKTISKLGIQEHISSLQLKKRPLLRKKPVRTLEESQGVYNITAFSTAEEYDLEDLVKGLKQEDLYTPYKIESNNDVIHAVAKYSLESEPREIFFLREGSVVLWNITELESSNILNFLRPYEHDRYSERIIQEEVDTMGYKHQIEGKAGDLDAVKGVFCITENTLQKFACTNAMALSVKLGIWEALLEKYIGSIEEVTEDLKRGTKVKMTQEQVLRKHGELFVLRHVMNLSSDLLDTPDFYWDREELEGLYLQTCNYFSIGRRTKVMNEKINHCIELIELLSSHLSDKHHVRLEWMIIVLIMVEVGFEIIHYADRYLT